MQELGYTRMNQPKVSEFLTPRQAASYLGITLPELKNLYRTRRLVAYKRRKEFVFKRRDVEGVLHILLDEKTQSGEVAKDAAMS